MNHAKSGCMCAQASATAEKVLKPPRNPIPQNGPGAMSPMAKQAAQLIANVTASTSASGDDGPAMSTTANRATAPKPAPRATLSPVPSPVPSPAVLRN